MQTPERLVREQLAEHWVLALATCGAGEPPYSTPLYYALLEREGEPPLLPFVSWPGSHHGRHLGDGPTAVSAAVFNERERIEEIRGLQIRGEVVRLERCRAEVRDLAQLTYLDRHPRARERLDSPGSVEVFYLLAPTWAKVTDHRIGFGVHPVAEFPLDWSRLLVV